MTVSVQEQIKTHKRLNLNALFNLDKTKQCPNFQQYARNVHIGFLSCPNYKAFIFNLLCALICFPNPMFHLYQESH